MRGLLVSILKIILIGFATGFLLLTIQEINMKELSMILAVFSTLLIIIFFFWKRYRALTSLIIVITWMVILVLDIILKVSIWEQLIDLFIVALWTSTYKDERKKLG